MTNMDDRPPPRGGITEGIRTGLGVLAAFRDAIEETIEEAVARGDLSPERAKNAVRDAAGRIQVSLEEVRERLDVIPRREFEALKLEVDELRRRVEALEGRATPPPALTDGGGVDNVPVD